MSNDFKRLNRTLVREGHILTYYEDTIALPDGRTVVYDLIHHKGAAAVVAVTEEGKLLMVTQYRNALDRYTLELPAGGRDYHEEPTIDCARRELEEETGYRCGRITKLLSLKSTVAFCDELIDVYLATDLTPTAQHLDDDEFINVSEHTIEELLAKIHSFEIQDAKTVAGILAYAAML